MSNLREPLRVSLVVIGAFNALSAIGGGIGLLTPGSLGMPTSVLEGSPFADFFWPALILMVVVGGTGLLAAITALRSSDSWLVWSAIAGFGMVIFVFVEVGVIQAVALLHIVYFVTGLAQLALVVALAVVLPRWNAPVRTPSVPVPERVAER